MSGEGGTHTAPAVAAGNLNEALERELRERVEEIDQLHRELRAARADLRVRDAYIAELRLDSPAIEEELRTLRLQHQRVQRLTGWARRAPLLSRIGRRLLRDRP